MAILCYAAVVIWVACEGAIVLDGSEMISATRLCSLSSRELVCPTAWFTVVVVELAP